VSPEGISTSDSLVLADAPPANAKDTPAAPNNGTVRLPRFRLGTCLASNIAAFSNILDEKIFDDCTANFFGYKTLRVPITMHRLECRPKLTSALVT
jgi:hypothetical protein